jgi:hypothetical protein
MKTCRSTLRRNCWRAAVEDGLAALEKLSAQLADVPTPAGPTPRELGDINQRSLPVLPSSIH